MKKIHKQNIKRYAVNLFSVFAVSTSIIFFLLIVQKLTVRDSLHFFALIHYATPLPVLLVAAVIYSIILIIIKKRMIYYSSFFLVVIFSLWWFSSSYFNNEYDSSEQADIRVLCWNVFKKAHLQTDEVVKIIKSEQPDIFGFIQVGEKHINSVAEKLDEKFPDYKIGILEQGMLIGTKGEITKNTYHKLTNGKLNKLKLRFKGKDIYVYLVHVASTPTVTRQFALKELFERVILDEKENLILMGDFNIPYNSVWFDQYKEQLQHAFALAGNGFIETWPLPFPFLSIDHIWTGKTLTPMKCKTASSRVSDHKMLIADFKIIK